MKCVTRVIGMRQDGCQALLDGVKFTVMISGAGFVRPDAGNGSLQGCSLEPKEAPGFHDVQECDQWLG